jgi:hypothetical protein
LIDGRHSVKMPSRGQDGFEAFALAMRCAGRCDATNKADVIALIRAGAERGIALPDDVTMQRRCGARCTCTATRARTGGCSDSGCPKGLAPPRKPRAARTRFECGSIRRNRDLPSHFKVHGEREPEVLVKPTGLPGQSFDSHRAQERARRRPLNLRRNFP